MSIQIPVEAKLNSGDIDAELAQFRQKINALGQSIAQANKIQFNPISKVTLDDLKKITAQFEALKRASPNFARDISGTGQSKKSFVDLDWDLMVSSRIAREARRFGAFNKVMAGTGATFVLPTQPPGRGGGGGSGGGGRGGRGRGPSSPGPGGRGGNPWTNAGRHVAGAGLEATGPVGSVANNALSAGLTGGVTAGLAGLVGGIFALGIGKAISSVTEKVGAAQTDIIGYDTMKRMLGDVNVGFEALRTSLHAASDAIDVTYPEIQKMGREFSQISGMSGDESKTLAEEVRIGGGFGRSFGMDPGQSNAFFARMRQFQVTNSEGDSRRLALYIGEAIAKSGTFAKADEMLQVISSYATQQTRLGLTSANVAGYSSALAGLVGSRIPGLDPIGAAGLLSHVNSAIASGGGGEAGQNFLFRAIGKRLGLDPIQTQAMEEQGAFGTGAATFGDKSFYSQFAEKYHLKTPSIAAGSNKTNLELAMDLFQSSYGSNPELMASAMSGLFKIPISQSMALATIGPVGIGGLRKQLAASGVDLNKMSSTGISSLAQVYSGDRDTLIGQARALWPQLNDKEGKTLTDAENSGDIERLRTVLVQLIAEHGQAQTEGEQTRKSLQDLDKDLMDAATKMIGPLNTMRDTLLYAFGNRGAMTAEDMHNAVVDAQRKSVNARADAVVKAAEDRYAKSLRTGLPSIYGPSKDDLAAQQKALADIDTAKADAERQRREGLAKIDAEEAARKAANTPPTPANNLPMPDWLKNGGAAALANGSSLDALVGAVAQQESGGRHIDPKTGKLITSSKGAQGITQIMPRTGADPGFGVRPLQNDSPEEYIRFTHDYLRAMLRRYDGDRDKALAAYNGGVGTVDEVTARYGQDWLSHMPKETRNYVSSVDTRLGTKLPDGASMADSSSVTHNVNVTTNGTFMLQNANGMPIPAQLQIATSVDNPKPYGARQ